MYNIIETVLIIVSILIIVAVLMQPTKQQDALNALSGGGGDLFSNQKKRGFEAFMVKVTYVLLVLFFACSVVLVYLSSHK